MSKSETLTIRISADLKGRMHAARAAMPYPPTVTTIIERGIVLAIAEMEKMTAAATE